MTDTTPLRLLFVCVENSCRSQMAEGWARELGGDDVVAGSAGSEPSGRVNPKAVESMAAAGVDISDQRSTGIPEAVGDWDAVIGMGCGDACPLVPGAVREEWDIPDPKHMDPADFAAVRDDIRRRVNDLISRLRS